jgi:hypothetical protein
MNTRELERNAIIIEWKAGKYIPRKSRTRDAYMIQYCGDCTVLDKNWHEVNINVFMNLFLGEVMFSELRHVINALYLQPMMGTNHTFKINRVKLT